MTEVIKTLATIFSQVSLVETAIFLIYCILGSVIYFVFQIWYPEYSKNKRQEIEREAKKTDMFSESLKNMNILLQQNTSVMQGFNRSIIMLDNTLDKVSDKLHAHDARAESLENNVQMVVQEMSRFKENTPTLSDFNRIHQRIDEIKDNLSDKRDVTLVLQKLDQILDSISQIRGKIM